MEIMLDRTGNVSSQTIHTLMNWITYHGKLVHGVSSSSSDKCELATSPLSSGFARVCKPAASHCCAVLILPGLTRSEIATRSRTMARPKQWISITRESRSMKRVREPDSTDTSSHEADEPSSETSESRGHQETWLEDDLNDGRQVKEAFSPGTMPPSSQEEEDSVILKSVVGPKTEYLSRDNKFTKAGSVQGLADGQVESAPASRDINFTGCQKGSDSAAAARGFDCTTCGKKFLSVWDIQEHPHLGVGICRSCRNFLFSSPYTKDSADGSEEQCRWCGEGGRIVMCDNCDKAFCEACIVRNFGPKDLVLIVSSRSWSCFSCNPELLRVPINEFKEFKKSVSSGRFQVRRKGASSAGKSCITRNASNTLRTDGEGATIAELLAQEEERRKQNPGNWTNPKVKPATRKVRASRKKTDTFPVALFPKHTGLAKVRHPSEIKRQEDVIKQAVPSVPQAKTYIRPHQWIEKRQQAAERRKRAEEAEAERLKNVTNVPNDDMKNHEYNSNTQAKSEHLPDIHCSEGEEVHLRHRGEDTGKLHTDNGKTQVKSEYLPDSATVAIGNEGKVAKSIFYSEGSNGDLQYI